MNTPRATNERFRPSERLRHALEFRAVYRRKWSAGGNHLVLHGLPNALGFNRLGLSVGRRLGSAVVRNRFKRRCREAFRRSKLRQPQGWDWVVAPNLKGGAPATARQSDLAEELLTLMHRIAARKRTARPKRDDPS